MRCLCLKMAGKYKNRSIYILPDLSEKINSE
jgi:hypothetical protein